MPTNNLVPLLDPELVDVFSSLPVLVDATVDPERARALRDARFASLAGDGTPSTVSRKDITIPGWESDDPDVLVRIYAHRQAGVAGPAIIWLHGGGFNGGSVKYEDSICEMLCLEVGATVVSVEYRLLPEHVHPAAVHDACAAVRWVSGSENTATVDPQRVAIAGLSAGATIAAAAAQLFRDRGETKLAFQLLLYGSMSNRLDTPSAQEFVDPRSPNRYLAANTWSQYLAGDRAQYGVPGHAASLVGLPPAYVVVGAVESARDENIEYARRLLEAHVPTELHVVPGAFHGFDVLVPEAAISKAARDEYVRVLRRGLKADAL